MKNQKNSDASSTAKHLTARKTVLIGLAALAAGAWLSTTQHRQKLRRYADFGTERRNPLNFFLAGRFPHRREIDQSGAHPLFERRQSVYDTY
ncbi:MAG TPA: hypothetical protein VJ654_12665 [Noviherbaspirillum sp.]|nr:hypothetical protein [Noviherbaspirillum sp.]